MAKIVILKVKDNIESIRENIRKIIDEFEIWGKLSINTKVVLKPNLTAIVEAEKEKSSLTDFRIVKALVELLHNRCRLFIFENSARGVNTKDVYARYGYNELSDTYRVEIVAGDDFRDAVKKKVNDPLLHDFIFVNRLIDEADILINLPVMKTHVVTGVTLGMKNLKGCMPDIENGRFHLTDLNKSIADLNKVIRPTLTIVDAIYAQEGDGPIAGKTKQLDYLFASDENIVLDWFLAKAMGFDPQGIEHIALAVKRGNIVPEDTQICGEMPLFNFERPTLSYLNLKLPDNLSQGRFNSGFLVPLVRCLESARFYFLTGRLRVYLLKRLRRFFRDRYWIDARRCNSCGNCVKVCPVNAVENNKKFTINKNCRLCNICIEFCPKGAVRTLFLHEN